MKSAPVPSNEVQRLASLTRLEILDTSPEVEFDALTKAASIVCGTPVSLISLIDSERQWFKANVGLPGVEETSRDIAFCSHAILNDGIFEIPDAFLDDRFADNPLVLGSPNIRFYAGAPIRLSDGSRIGTICVIDRRPKQLTEQQREVMQCLAIAASATIEGRKAMRDHKNLTLNLLEGEDQLRRLYRRTPALLVSFDARGKILSVSDGLATRLGLDSVEIIGRHLSEFLDEQSRGNFEFGRLNELLHSDRAGKIRCQLHTRLGAKIDADFSGVIEHEYAGMTSVCIGVLQDLSG